MSNPSEMPQRHRACEDGAHAACPHLCAPAPANYGSAALCNCNCHSSCPLATENSVTLTAWRNACRCSGALESQQMLDRAGLSTADIEAHLERVQMSIGRRIEEFKAAHASAGDFARREPLSRRHPALCRMPGGGKILNACKRSLARWSIMRMYRGALAQRASETVSRSSEMSLTLPDERRSVAVDLLAKLTTEAEAARALELTLEQVRAERARAKVIWRRLMPNVSDILT